MLNVLCLDNLKISCMIRSPLAVCRHAYIYMSSRQRDLVDSSHINVYIRNRCWVSNVAIGSLEFEMCLDQV